MALSIGDCVRPGEGIGLKLKKNILFTYKSAHNIRKIGEKNNDNKIYFFGKLMSIDGTWDYSNSD